MLGSPWILTPFALGIPKTSQWKNNWEQPKLDNFRQNVPGDVNAQGIADATAGASNA